MILPKKSESSGIENSPGPALDGKYIRGMSALESLEDNDHVLDETV
jgi:hypothetical protein